MVKLIEAPVEHTDIMLFCYKYVCLFNLLHKTLKQISTDVNFDAQPRYIY